MGESNTPNIQLFFETLAKIIGQREQVEIKVVSISKTEAKTA